jgi:hypothetical protein
MLFSLQFAALRQRGHESERREGEFASFLARQQNEIRPGRLRNLGSSKVSTLPTYSISLSLL